MCSLSLSLKAVPELTNLAFHWQLSFCSLRPLCPFIHSFILCDHHHLTTPPLDLCVSSSTYNLCSNYILYQVKFGPSSSLLYIYIHTYQTPCKSYRIRSTNIPNSSVCVQCRLCCEGATREHTHTPLALGKCQCVCVYVLVGTPPTRGAAILSTSTRCVSGSVSVFVCR